MIPFEPYGDRVVVRPEERPDTVTTPGGIELPVDTDIEKVSTGIVVLIGPDVTVPLEIGDRVLHGLYSGLMITVAGIKYKVFNSYDIVGRLTDNTEISAA